MLLRTTVSASMFGSTSSADSVSASAAASKLVIQPTLEHPVLDRGAGLLDPRTVDLTAGGQHPQPGAPRLHGADTRVDTVLIPGCAVTARHTADHATKGVQATDDASPVCRQALHR